MQDRVYEAVVFLTLIFEASKGDVVVLVFDHLELILHLLRPLFKHIIVLKTAFDSFIVVLAVLILFKLAFAILEFVYQIVCLKVMSSCF